MKRLMYMELKSNRGDCGPAWIGRVTLSRSGRTIYFNGRALKRQAGGGVSSNHTCLETGEAFWVSGPKRDGRDRHWAGSGVIQVEQDALEEYLSFRGLESLNSSQYRIVNDVLETDVARFERLENQA